MRLTRVFEALSLGFSQGHATPTPSVSMHLADFTHCRGGFEHFSFGARPFSERCARSAIPGTWPLILDWSVGLCGSRLRPVNLADDHRRLRWGVVLYQTSQGLPWQTVRQVVQEERLTWRQAEFCHYWFLERVPRFFFQRSRRMLFNVGQPDSTHCQCRRTRRHRAFSCIGHRRPMPRSTSTDSHAETERGRSERVAQRRGF